MQKKARDKMMKPESKQVKNKYFFPELQKTVEAESREEAEKKVKKLSK